MLNTNHWAHPRVSESLSLQWNLTICISDKFSDYTEAAGQGTTLGIILLKDMAISVLFSFSVGWMS